MRLLIEIVVIGALIALAWQKSFKEWASEAPVIGQHFTAPTPAPPPKAKVPSPPATAATTPQTFTGHIYYTDEAGKKYWLDAQGKRHYEP